MLMLQNRKETQVLRAACWLKQAALSEAFVLYTAIIFFQQWICTKVSCTGNKLMDLFKKDQYYTASHIHAIMAKQMLEK